MINLFKKTDRPVLVNKYREKIEVFYKDGKNEIFQGESNCIPAVYTFINGKILNVCEYKLPCELDKTYLRDVSNIDYIKRYKTEIIKGENNG